MKTARTIAIANQKGGVGKTTTCVNLASALVEIGKKVLLIDNDPQANLSSYLNTTNNPEKATLDELYLAKRAPSYNDAKDKFVQTFQVNLDFIASDKNLAGVDFYLYSRGDREFVLKNNLAWARGEYDFILIDNPPSLNLLTYNALTASDEVIIPVQTEYFSLEGIAKMHDLIQLVRERFNPLLKISGILPTQVDLRKKLTAEILDLLARQFPNQLMKSRIRENSKVAESSGAKKPVLKYAAASGGAEDFRALAEELVS